jgi:hypothetical protein
MRRSSVGETVPRQNSSTHASVLMPSVAGSTWIVKDRITPSASSRSTRRLTADAERPTTAPMSPYADRALRFSRSMMRESMASMPPG